MNTKTAISFEWRAAAIGGPSRMSFEGTFNAHLKCNERGVEIHA